MIGLQPAARLPEHLIANARLLPDRYAILPLLPKRKVIVEVGVATGNLSSRFLKVCEPACFIAIDLFTLHRYPVLFGQPTDKVLGGQSHAAYYRQLFAEHISRGSVVVLEGDSADLLATLGDSSVDIVYVDADHSYEAVKRDLSVIKHKIKDDGFIILNDYIMMAAGVTSRPYGVIQATNEFMIAENWEMIYFAFQPYMFCDVVLRKVGCPPATMATPERALEVMRASTSWRVTAPLRALRRSLAHLRIWPMRQE